MPKKLIEVALPLEAINKEASREKSIRHGHPSTLHLWWARRPLAACRAVLFAQLVDDPGEYMPDENSADAERERLFRLLEELVKWENINDADLLNRARLEIARSVARELGVDAPIGEAAVREFLAEKAPPVLDPFAGGGSIPLEAQRLGLRAIASDLNPVAVLINKALIEIPPKFADLPPVHPSSHPAAGGREAPTPNPSPTAGGREAPTPNPSPTMGGGEKWEVPERLHRKMVMVARRLRRESTPSEKVLWEALRGKKLEGVKFRRQQPIGPFVVDFYAPSQRLIIEVDGPIHQTQRAADQERQELLESLGLRFVRLPASLVEQNLPAALDKIRSALLPPSPLVGEGGQGWERGQIPLFRRQWHGAQGLAEDVRYYGQWMRDQAEKRIGYLYPKVTLTADILATRPDLRQQGYRAGDQLTVIAWLWARTVTCPNPACGAQMPLVRSFWLSKKKNKKAWVEPVLPTPRGRGAGGEGVQFTIKTGQGSPPEGTVNRRGARCIVCGTPVPFDYIRAEGKAGRMGAQLMAIVAEGRRGRVYFAPLPEHETVARQAQPQWKPETSLPEQALGFRVQLYGMTRHADLFTPRQLTALTTFSDLVGEARARVERDARAAGWPDSQARAYADAVATYLAFAVDKSADYWNSIATWGEGFIRNCFARQAIPMVWDFAEANPFSDSTGNVLGALDWVKLSVEMLPAVSNSNSQQCDAASMHWQEEIVISTDPPYYDNIGYADLSDFFYVWLRRSLKEIYPNLFRTLLVPKAPELVATPYRFGGDKNAARRFFEGGLQQVFANLRRSAHPAYPLTVYYAFKQSETASPSPRRGGGVRGGGAVRASTGWETMLAGLIAAGFQITGTWPMRTERKGRSVALGTNALASSIVLVCRPRPAEAPRATRREFLAALRRELPAALRGLQQGSIAPVDLAQAAIGPGMAVFSRYRQVLEADGSAMAVRTALTLINQVLDEFLSEQEGEYDAATRWALAWFEQYGHEEGPYGVAETLSKAKNTSVEGLARIGILEARAGKVRLRRRAEMFPASTQEGEAGSAHGGRAQASLTAWEAVQHLIQALDTGGERAAAGLLARLGPTGEAARDLAYHLYAICERKGWTQDALGYNMLAVAWLRLRELAQEQERQQGRFI